MSLKNDLMVAFRSWAENRGLVPEICFVLSGRDGVPVWVAGDKEDLVLNVSSEAIRDFESDSEEWVFLARFGEDATEIRIDVRKIRWIHARGTKFCVSYPSELDDMEREMFDAKKENQGKGSPRPSIVVVK